MIRPMGVPIPRDVYDAEEREIQMQRLDKASYAIGAILAMLPREDRTIVLNAQLNNQLSLVGTGQHVECEPEGVDSAADTDAPSPDEGLTWLEHHDLHQRDE